MRIQWPSMLFGPVNLWNAPRQNVAPSGAIPPERARQECLEALSAELEGSCRPLSEVADDWGLPEESLLEMLEESGDVELCTTCGWWFATDELEIIDDEHTCDDCR